MKYTIIYILDGATSERTGGELGYCMSIEEAEAKAPSAGWFGSPAKIIATPAYIDEAGNVFTPTKLKRIG